MKQYLRPHNIINITNALAIITISLIVAGCTTVPSSPKNTTPSYITITKDIKPIDKIFIETEHHPTLNTNNVTTILQEASLLLINDDISAAKELLDKIEYANLSEDLQETLAMQQARIADLTEQSWEVFNWVDRKVIINSSNSDTIALAHILRARAYNHFTEYRAALDEWISALPLLNQQQQALYQDDFWQTLLHEPSFRLKKLMNQASDNFIISWLELAILYQPGVPLKKQLASLQMWLKRWPDHPGKVYLPSNFEKLKASIVSTPKKIALLLPLSGNLGKAGRSIRDGFIAANYEDLQLKRKTPEIIILDTNGNDIGQVLEQAIQQGTELIIGPLDKENVRRLHDIITNKVPILALNYLDTQPETTPTHLYQFGLSAEDEARMIAKKGLLEGYKRAIVLTPDSPWGKKIGNTFSNTWQAAGGELVAHTEFNTKTEFSKLSAQLLLVNQSIQRAGALKKILKKPIGFRARRRQDVDMIFIAASPEEARQIKPSLSYHFAGNIPVYATSSIYSGKTNTTRDQDINGIQVPIMPWSEPNITNKLKHTIINIWPQSKGQYGTLYALGADAYKLYPKLQQLINLPGSHIEGLTGRLSISKDNRVDRNLSWLIFKNGRLSRPQMKHHTKI